MTVIAWDGATLAADKRCGVNFNRKVTKIRRLPSGELVGFSGWIDRGLVLVDWYEKGGDLAKLPEWQKVEATSCELIIVKPDRTLWCLGEYGIPWQVENRCHSIGSGRDFAAAAMHLGKTAVEAVLIASELSATCGDGIDTLTLAPCGASKFGEEVEL